MNSSSANRADHTLYMIFAYLTLFRLDELQMEDYRKIVYSQENVKMHVFLQFIFNVDILKENVREEWIKLYDYTYIDETVIGGIERNLPNVADILATVEKRATGQVVSSLTQSSFSAAAAKSGDETLVKTLMETESTRKRTPTKVEPFKLTKPKPKVIPKPEPLKREVKANPLNKKVLYGKSLADIEKEKQERRKQKINRVKQEYESSSIQKFDLKTAKTDYDIEKVREQHLEEEKKKLKFNEKHARKMPKFEEIEAPIKVNTAAILREGHLLKKRQEGEEEIMRDLELNMRDASEFERWKREMNEKDDIERIEHIQRKKIEMEMARNEAIEAKKREEREHKHNADKMKIQSKIREDIRK